MQQFGFQMIFAQAGPRHTHCAAMGAGGNLPGALHDRVFTRIFEQAHFSQQRIQAMDGGRCANADAGLPAQLVEPALQLAIAICLFAERVKNRRRIGQQFRHFGIDGVDRKRGVESELLAGGVRAEAIAVPDFPLQVFFPAKQDRL